MSRKVRYPVTGVSEAPVGATLRIRTRIRYSAADMVVLVALARHFERLQGQDLAVRCAARLAHDTAAWAARKRVLTKECSARFAGWITKSSNDAYAAGRRNERRALAGTEQTIAVIEEKLRRPVRSAAGRRSLRQTEAQAALAEGRKPRRLDFGYRSQHEHAMKRQRLERLRAVRDRLQRDERAGRVHITRGGKTLLRNRLHLDQAGLTEQEWRARWHARRWSFGANGETGKRYGNETIRVFPDGTLEIDLPPPLAHLANVTARGVTRYRFDARIAFSYHTQDWLAQMEANRAVAYDFCFDPRGRTYLDASFTPAEPPPVPRLAALLADPGLRVLALDLNHGFLAPAVLDRSGNPIARLTHIPLITENLPASVRDGHLRAAIIQALDLAQARGCSLVAVENLGFDQIRATGRERYGSARRFRKVICGLPTAQFRERLAAMAARRGIAVVGVPAAYSSIWGRAHWQRPTSTARHKVSGHTAAAVVLGRRALGHRARRKAPASPGVTAGDQRIEAAGPGPAPAESYHVPETRRPRERPQGPRRSPAARGHWPKAGTPARTPGQTRSGNGVTPGIPGQRRPFAPAPLEAYHPRADRR
jgi:hypothetical protein